MADVWKSTESEPTLGMGVTQGKVTQGNRGPGNKAGGEKGLHKTAPEDRDARVPRPTPEGGRAGGVPRSNHSGSKKTVG